MIMKHASHINSPWYMQVSFKGYSRKLSDPEHIMKISAEVQAPPDLIWSIDGCQTNLRASPGQWHQVKVHWNKKTLSLYLDGNLCGTTEARVSTIDADIKQRFSTRRTPFIFIGYHTIEDFIFNDKELLPDFRHLSTLSNQTDNLDSVVSNITGDFYSTFQLDGSRDFPFVKLPGIDITESGDDGKLAVEDKINKMCRVFQLPKLCKDTGICNLEVERRGSKISVFSQGVKLSTVSENNLCDIAREYRMRERIIQTTGLMTNTQIELFDREKKFLEDRRLIHTCELVIFHAF